MSPALMVKPTIYVAEEMVSLKNIITLTDPGNIFLDRELLITRAFHQVPKHFSQQNTKNIQMHLYPLSNISNLEDPQKEMFIDGADIFLWTRETCNNTVSQSVNPVFIPKQQNLAQSFITFRSSEYARAVIAWKEHVPNSDQQSTLKAVIVTNPFYAFKLHNYLTSLIRAK